MAAYDDPVVLAKRVGDGPLLCCADFDGTLAPLAPTPAAAAPLPGVVTVLSELTLLPDVRVAIVSGRTVEDVRSRLDVAGAYYIGVHGIEVQRPGGPLTVQPEMDALRSAMAAIRRRMQERVNDLPGVLLEDKGIALACHYRLASERDAETLRAWAAEVLAAAQVEGLAVEIVSGHKVVEFRPQQANKGAAVLALRAPAEGTLYAGDDETDEDAFRALPADALTIRVGPLSVPTSARYRLAGPDAVLTFLCALLACRASLPRG